MYGTTKILSLIVHPPRNCRPLADPRFDPHQSIQETVTYRHLAQWPQRLRASGYDRTEIAPRHLFGCGPGRCAIIAGSRVLMVAPLAHVITLVTPGLGICCRGFFFAERWNGLYDRFPAALDRRGA